MMPASWRAVLPLLLPFLIVQLQYIQLQIFLLATRRRYAMKIRRHYHRDSTVPLANSNAKPRRCAMTMCHVAPQALAAPSERSLPEDVPFYPDTLSRNAPAYIRRHYHSTSERIGCPLIGGVAPARKNCRHRRTLMPRFLRGRLLSPEHPASCHCLQALAVSKLRLRTRKNSPGAREA
jgi:hypothetical protein